MNRLITAVMCITLTGCAQKSPNTFTVLSQTMIYDLGMPLVSYSNVYESNEAQIQTASLQRQTLKPSLKYSDFIYRKSLPSQIYDRVLFHRYAGGMETKTQIEANQNADTTTLSVDDAIEDEVR